MTIDGSTARHSLNRLPGLLLLVGGLLGLHLGWQTMSHSVEAQSWPYVEGTVIASRLATNALGGYRPHVNYRFTANNRTYYGDSLYAPQRHHLPLPTRKTAEETIARYAPGATVVVYFDPADPQRCLIEPRFAWWGILPLAGGTLLLFAGGYKLRGRNSDS